MERKANAYVRDLEMQDKSRDFHEVCSEEIYNNMMVIANLVNSARMQAKEAEVRARYAIEFANKAVREAKAAHVVSESLARTSRVVASLALEVSNDADEYLTSYRCENDPEHDSFNDSSFRSDATYGDNSYMSDITESDISTTDCLTNNQHSSGDSVCPKSSKNTYNVAYPPEEQPMVEINGPSMPTVLEESNDDVTFDESVSEETDQCDDSTNEPSAKWDDDVSVNELSRRLHDMDERRRMLLYRDSKRLFAHGRLCDVTDVKLQPMAYAEQGTQTTVQAAC